MRKLLLLVTCLLATLAGPAAAQPAGGDDDAAFLGAGGDTEPGPTGDPAEPDGALAGGGPADSGDAGFLQGGGEGQPLIAPPEEDPELALVEDPTKSYYLVGLRTHALFVPDFLIQAFGLEHFDTVYGWALGPEFTYRRNGLDIIASVWWGSYPVDTWTREDGDPISETEIIKSTLGLVWITAEFISGYEFEPWVSLVYGGGFGIGIKTGEVTRDEAFQDSAGGWVACDDDSDPRDPDDFCEAGGNYGPIPEKADGIWPVYPMITGKIGARFKPLRNLVITPEFGIGMPELFTLGLRVNYMF
ncbi:MAG: hypothetical protein JXB32_26075 [Deltaproteobacteria bacterium]|nr:hypothetical protein [Deltaproteobacteria bacterium]